MTDEEASENLVRKHHRLMEEMKKAIAEGVLSNDDKEHISLETEALRDSILHKEEITTEEEHILHNIETTYNLIMKIEQEYLNQYINYLRKK